MLLEFPSELKRLLCGRQYVKYKNGGDSVRMLCSDAERIPLFLSRGNWVLFLLVSK